jgi:head-tail adaptor
MLSAAEITAMRATLVDSLPDSVVIQRATYVADGMGGSVATWSAAGTVSGRVSPGPAQGDEQITGGRPVADGPWVVTVPSGTDVTERDRIAFGSTTLEVRKVDTPRSWAIDIRCECEVVR